METKQKSPHNETMKWLEASLLEALFIAVLLTAPVDAESVDRLDDHICPGSAYVASNNTNVWTFFKDRSGPLTPEMRYINNVWGYAYWHPFQVGQTLYFRGKMQPGTHLFEFNILAGAAVDTEGVGQTLLCMQFGYRPDWTGFIKLSSKKNGQWSNTVQIDKSPLLPRQFFDLSIYAMEDRFEIRLNKKFLVEYTYQIGLDYFLYQNARKVDLDKVFIGGQIFQMPYSAAFPDGRFNFLDSIMLQAVAEKDFSINIINARNDVALKFSVNFAEKCVIRNAKVAGQWGEREKNGTFPFTAGDEFELQIFNTPLFFTYFVNGKHLGTFIHRAKSAELYPIEYYSTLEITGRVSLRHLSICKAKV
uniref:Galectin n=1 Tax=Panagrellus redivivus TaxID=6233 RepID=A0A7E4V3X1_PANRE